MTDLGAVRLSRKTGAELLTASGLRTGLTLVDFWSWRLSDLLDNLERGGLAEFIVATALGATEEMQVPGAVWDLTTPTDIKVEVKSAAYLQSFGQKSLSAIRFGTSKTLAWDRETNTFEAVPKRHAHVYVFALLAHTDKATVNPLELDQWLFYVLNTAVLNQRGTDSITLEALSALTAVKGFSELRFGELRDAVEAAAGAG